ncbi:MAG: DUF1326 domain-containing protein [Acidimicrobiia bacterium]|nr:DUF1326 domain-containing protein [Acidimicrobiia bacterium]
MSPPPGVVRPGERRYPSDWTVGVLLDERADDAQTGAIGSVVSGEAGGVFAALAPLITDFRGIERVPIEITSDGTNHHVHAGGIDYEGQVTRAPSGDAVEITNIVVHPAGPTLAVAPVGRADNNAFGVSWSGSGLSGFSNRFAWVA